MQFTWNLQCVRHVYLGSARLNQGKIDMESKKIGPVEEVAGGLPSFDEARTEFMRNYLRQVLELCGGNISRAARLAGRNRTDLYKLLHRHGLSPAEFKGQARSRPTGSAAT